MMKRGISPVIATVILITLAVVAGASLYFWSMSYSPRPELPKEPIKISVRPVNQTAIKIVNLGMSSIPLSNISLSNGAVLECSNKTLEPGGTVSCEIKNTTEGEVAIVISGQEVETPTIIVHTGDIDPPSFAGITDNWHYSIVGDTITVTATISDNVGVDKAVLYYKPPGGSWSSESMSRISGTEKYGQWQASFTPNSVGNWEYYVWANDTSGNERTSNTVSRAIGVVKFISPTPADGAAISSKDFTINLTLAGDPRRIVLNFNGTNFTIFGSDELYYFKFDDVSATIKNEINQSNSIGEYEKLVLGYVNDSSDTLPPGWYGTNIHRGSRDWCGWYEAGKRYQIDYANSTIANPQVGHTYVLGYNGTGTWDLENTTNMYFDYYATLDSGNFSASKVCLIDKNDNKACIDIGFSANVGNHMWIIRETDYVKNYGGWHTDPNFDWTAVDRYELELTSNTTQPFSMALGPLRIAYRSNYRGEGVWDTRGLDPNSGRSSESKYNWCNEGYLGRVYYPYPMDTSHFTVSTWFKYNYTGDADYFGIVDMFGDGNWCDGFTLNRDYSKIEFRIGYHFCSTNHYANNTYVKADWGLVGDGKWHLLTGVENGTNITLYIDGKRVASSQSPDTMDKHGDYGLIGYPGASITWSGTSAFGPLDEFHLFNYSLTPDQVKLLYHLEYGRWYAKLHNLNPGEYAFKVYATTNLGSSSTETREIDIV